MSKPSLVTDFCGLRLLNPFLLASTPATATGEMIERAFEHGWAGAVWKTIGKVPNVSNPKVSPRYVAVRVGGHQPIGFENIDLGNVHPIDETFAEMAALKRRYPDRVIIASIRGGDEPNAWQHLAGRAEEAGADMVEAMFSCPHDTAGDDQAHAASMAEMTGRITHWVRQATSLPIMVKMSPNVSDMRPLARSAKRHGAAAISVANTIRCVAGVDLDTLRPLPSVDGLSTYGGYSGPAIKPIILRFVAELASDPQLGLPISGVGGITSWRDAVEYLLLGASSLQVGTAVMLYGYRIIDNLLDGLWRFVDAHSFTDVQSMVGVSLQYLVLHQMLSRNCKMVPVIDLATCVRCGNCYVACRDSGHQAITFDVDRTPGVDLGLCEGCGLCQQVCPVLECVRMCPAPQDDATD